MPNVMLTDVCNLKCPYCFANEFVNKYANEITLDNFRKAVEFILRDGSTDCIGLIGGEPTLHSKFENIVRYLISEEKIRRIVIYTNGVYLDKYWNFICNPKIHFLINCNSKTDMGEYAFERMINNINYLLEERQFKDNVTLGINMYNPQFEYNYFVELLTKYKFKRARVSITVPNLEENRNSNAHLYFSEIKNRVLEFFHVLLSNGIVPNFDCNKIPYCLLTEHEIDGFKKYMDNKKIKDILTTSNIISSEVVCSPVIDILQDLTAVRCFGLSSCSKEKISNFKGIKDLKNHYIRSIDSYSFNISYCDECQECYSRKILKCNGGCIAFKQNKILKMQKEVNRINGL